MEVVAQPHVRGRRLRHDGRQRRMRIERAHHREPGRVARPDHADAAVVPGHVGEQPFDRVVGVGALVDRLRVLAIARLPQHHERALGLEPPADVLQHDDVAVGRAVRRGAAADAGGRVLTDAVRRAREDDRQRLGDAGRHVHLGVEANAVAHRDHVLGARERRGGWCLACRAGATTVTIGDRDESNQRTHGVRLRTEVQHVDRARVLSAADRCARARRRDAIDRRGSRHATRRAAARAASRLPARRARAADRGQPSTSAGVISTSMSARRLRSRPPTWPLRS